MSKEMTEYQKGIINAFARDPRFRSRDDLIAFAERMEAAINETRVTISKMRDHISDGHLNIPYYPRDLEPRDIPAPDPIWERRKNEPRSNGSSSLTSSPVKQEIPTHLNPTQQIEKAIASTETALLDNLKGQHPLDEIHQLATSIVMYLTGLNQNTHNKPLTGNDS